MNFDKNTPRILGIAFLFQAIVALLSDLPLSSLIEGYPYETINISTSMISISNNPSMMQISIIGKLITAIGIMLLTVLLYTTLKTQNKVIARWAFGLRFTEVATYAVIAISAFSLLYISQEFVTAGVPDASYFQTLGNLFYESMDYAYSINMLFFSLGAFLFYYLFLKSNYIPKLFSVWGLVSTSLSLIGILFGLFGYNLDLAFYVIAFLPILPLELALGVWLTIKGFRTQK